MPEFALRFAIGSGRDAIYAHADQVADDFGAVNLIINNAGVALSASVREMIDREMKL